MEICARKRFGVWLGEPRGEGMSEGCEVRTAHISCILEHSSSLTLPSCSQQRLEAEVSRNF